MNLTKVLLCSGLLLPGAANPSVNLPKAAENKPTRIRGKAPKLPKIFEATAYCISGVTALGHVTRERHTAAADPDVIPLGTRIRVSGAGRYSGTYLVTDTGAAVKGNVIDIYMENKEEAMQFGRQLVKVRIVNPPAQQTVRRVPFASAYQ